MPRVTTEAFARLMLVTMIASLPDVALAAEAAYHHVHLNVPEPEVAVEWYIKHIGCQVRPGRKDACQFGPSMYWPSTPAPIRV